MGNIKVLFCDNTLWGLINFRGDVITYFKNIGCEVVLVAPEKEDEQMRTEIPEYGGMSLYKWDEQQRTRWTT